MIRRSFYNNILSKLHRGKAIIILGARQVGKTTLLKSLFSNSTDVLWLNGDEIDIQNQFENISATRLKAILGSKKILVIDEAQRIENVGIKLKLIIDSIPDVQVIATGSSSFDLTDKINEPLTGRKWEYKMFPLSFHEMKEHHGLLDEKRMLPHRLIYGYYPDVVTNPGDEKEILKLLSDSYLYKDILMWEGIKKPEKLVKLLQALAFQVGSQVSYNELAQLCGMDSKTVDKYIDVLEKAFVIFRLGSFRRNLRSELKNSKKIYFYDNGIRNVLISNFTQVENRQDIGALWENFILSERIKYLSYKSPWTNYWYWRTKDQKEIDYLEETDGKITAYEFKWNPNSKIKKQGLFLKTYPSSNLNIIHRENFDQFLLP